MKEPIIFSNYETIQKANSLSFSAINKSLTLSQLRLLSYAILKLPLIGDTAVFRMRDIAEFLNVKKYLKRQYDVDSTAIMEIIFSVEDEEFESNDNGEKGKQQKLNLIRSMRYDNGEITCRFEESFLPKLQELTTKYMTLDLSIMKKFKSEYSWYLYEHLKAHYGTKFNNLKKLTMSVDELKEIFHIGDNTSYATHFGLLKKKILNKAVEEINNLTEITLEVKELKKGNKVIAVEFEWTIDEIKYGVTPQQVEYFESRKKELLTLDEFVENPIYLPFVRMYETLDYNVMTKDQLDITIKKTDEIIKEIKLQQEKSDGLDLEDENIVEIIKDKALEKLIQMGQKQAFVDFFGEQLFEISFELAKKNMKHLDSVDSIAFYVAEVIIDKAKEMF